jgi:hypothetical protein
MGSVMRNPSCRYQTKEAQLDELERPFAAYNRERFGLPSSRER